MKTAINSISPSFLSEPQKLLSLAAAQRSSPLMFLSACLPAGVCVSVCTPCVCLWACEWAGGCLWGLWDSKQSLEITICSSHLYPNPLRIPSTKQNGRLTLSPLAPSSPCKWSRQCKCAHTHRQGQTHTHTQEKELVWLCFSWIKLMGVSGARTGGQRMRWERT